MWGGGCQPWELGGWAGDSSNPGGGRLATGEPGGACVPSCQPALVVAPGVFSTACPDAEMGHVLPIATGAASGAADSSGRLCPEPACNMARKADPGCTCP